MKNTGAFDDPDHDPFDTDMQIEQDRDFNPALAVPTPWLDFDLDDLLPPEPAEGDFWIEPDEEDW